MNKHKVIKLKNCPFCGGGARVHLLDVGYSIDCANPLCKNVICTPQTATIEEAANTWNERAETGEEIAKGFAKYLVDKVSSEACDWFKDYMEQRDGEQASINEGKTGYSENFDFDVGDLVWTTVYGTISAHNILQIQYMKNDYVKSICYIYEIGGTTDSFMGEAVGKTFFKTKEEAEKHKEEVK